MSARRLSGGVCPPHRWWVTIEPSAEGYVDHHVCLGCGATKDHARPPVERSTGWPGSRRYKTTATATEKRA